MCDSSTKKSWPLVLGQVLLLVLVGPGQQMKPPSFFLRKCFPCLGLLHISGKAWGQFVLVARVAQLLGVTSLHRPAELGEKRDAVH